MDSFRKKSKPDSSPGEKDVQHQRCAPRSVRHPPASLNGSPGDAGRSGRIKGTPASKRSSRNPPAYCSVGIVLRRSQRPMCQGSLRGVTAGLVGQWLAATKQASHIDGCARSVPYRTQAKNCRRTQRIWRHGIGARGSLPEECGAAHAGHVGRLRQFRFPGVAGQRNHGIAAIGRTPSIAGQARTLTIRMAGVPRLEIEMRHRPQGCAHCASL